MHITAKINGEVYEVEFPAIASNLEDLVEQVGAQRVYKAAMSQFRNSAVQGVRARVQNGDTDAQIQDWAKTWQPGARSRMSEAERLAKWVEEHGEEGKQALFDTVRRLQKQALHTAAAD